VGRYPGRYTGRVTSRQVNMRLAEFDRARLDRLAAARDNGAARNFRRWAKGPRTTAIVALLASPRTANVTGANYVIDGGLVKTT
jgi:hypothetical protein